MHVWRKPTIPFQIESTCDFEMKCIAVDFNGGLWPNWMKVKLDDIPVGILGELITDFLCRIWNGLLNLWSI